MSGKGRPGRGRQANVRRTVGLAARRIAAECLGEIVDKGRRIDQVLGPGGHALYPALIAKDRALVRAILGAALRHHGAITTILARLVETPPPRRVARLAHVLGVGAAQVLYLDVPDHATVALAVETAAQDRDMRHYKGLVNAVMRRLSTEKDALLGELDEVRINTPDWLFDGWVAAYGEATARRIAEAHLHEAALDLTVKTDAAGWAGRLGGAVLPTGSVRLSGGGRIEDLDGFAEGAWWVQDTAASLPARLLGAVSGKRVADLCAAPGGKTAQLAAAGADVVALDQSAERLERLGANLFRLGLSARVVAADILDWQPGETYEAVLLDAPCSATGTIRRHPDIPLLKRAEDIAALAETQKKLAARAADLVAPGGTLLYCTCSLEPAEGEAVVAALLAGGAPFERVPIRAEEVPGLADAITPAGELRTLPFMLAAPEGLPGGLDGFFIARLQRI